MDTRGRLEGEESSSEVPVAPGTLGAVLYSGTGKRLVSEAEWAGLVRDVAGGSPLALHALYERAHRIVYALAVRITLNPETAEEVTLDVFHDVWRRAGAYDPANGTVLGWIMNQARSRAIDRLRFEHRQKRTDPGMAADDVHAAEAADPRALVEARQQSAALRSALALLSRDERVAIECAYFSGLTHAEIAAQLGEPLGTVKTRIRAGLQKLRQAVSQEARP